MRSNTYRIALRRLAATVVVMTLAASATLASDQGAQEVTHDGLELVPDTDVAAAWVKPGADFTPFSKVMILEAYVAFKKNWQMNHNRGSINRITDRDVQNIKTETSRLFHQVFTEVIEKGGYPVVEDPGPEVMLLRPAIIDLDITAPSTARSTGRSFSFASSAGAATLFLEIYDSVSGEILARVVDRRGATSNSSNFMQWTTELTNRNEASRTLAGWARLLVAELDDVHHGDEN